MGSRLVVAVGRVLGDRSQLVLLVPRIDRDVEGAAVKRLARRRGLELGDAVSRRVIKHVIRAVEENAVGGTGGGYRAGRTGRRRPVAVGVERVAEIRRRRAGEVRIAHRGRRHVAADRVAELRCGIVIVVGVGPSRITRSRAECPVRRIVSVLVGILVAHQTVVRVAPVVAGQDAAAGRAATAEIIQVGEFGIVVVSVDRVVNGVTAAGLVGFHP